MSGLAEHGAALLGGGLARAESVGGGNLSRVIRIFLDDGRAAIVKDGPAPLVEAAMLRAIYAAGAPAPEVYGADSNVIVMESLVSRDGDADADLGHAVARLHAATGERYG